MRLKSGRFNSIVMTLSTWISLNMYIDQTTSFPLKHSLWSWQDSSVISSQLPLSPALGFCCSLLAGPCLYLHTLSIHTDTYTIVFTYKLNNKYFKYSIICCLWCKKMNYWASSVCFKYITVIALFATGLDTK